MSVQSIARATARPEALRLVTALPSEVAFSRAVVHLMTRPAFARAPFGHIARTLAGQVNRGHYAFAMGVGATVGFAGWALASEDRAEAWLANARPLANAEALEGDCVVLNCWQADSPEVSRFLIERLIPTVADKRRLYAKRHYPDGRCRPVRLDLGRAPRARPEPARAG
jgi:hemolysin-activating ACP:hemolysin acyltransferase